MQTTYLLTYLLWCRLAAVKRAVRNNAARIFSVLLLCFFLYVYCLPSWVN